MIPLTNLSYPITGLEKLNQVFSSMDVYNGTGYLLGTPPLLSLCREFA